MIVKQRRLRWAMGDKKCRQNFDVETCWIMLHARPKRRSEDNIKVDRGQVAVGDVKCV